MSLDWFRRVARLLGGRGRSITGIEHTRLSGSTLDGDALKEFVRAILSTRPDEIACEECFKELDRFVEFMLDGQDAARALPLVHDHLARCSDCGEEFRALLVALQALNG